MREPKWTPGPWQSRQTEKGDFRIEQAPCGAIVGKTFGGLKDEERRNADLMAAAPELYEALAKYVEHFGDPLKCANKALAKARGESQ